MKECSCCNKIKQLKDFHKSRNSKDGYRSKCRICTNLKRRETLEMKRFLKDLKVPFVECETEEDALKSLVNKLENP